MHRAYELQFLCVIVRRGNLGPLALGVLHWSAKGTGPHYLEKIRVLKAGQGRLDTKAWNKKIGGPSPSFLGFVGGVFIDQQGQTEALVLRGKG